MEYKQVLNMLAILGKSAWFNSRELSDTFLGILNTRGIQDYALLLRQFSTKRISSNLDRLYRMGFLNRKRVSRLVHPKGSHPCFKGCIYNYRLSKQGWQYLDYLAMSKRETNTGDAIVQKIITNDIRLRMPEPIAHLFEESLFRLAQKDKGRYNRFPRK